MNINKVKIIIAAAVVAVGTTACTQAQQRSISNADLERNLQNGVKDLSKRIASSGQWLDTQSEIWKLRAKIETSREKVSQSQQRSLDNSIAFIEQEQQQSIDSGTGISAAESAKISGDVDRVETRLSGWLAANEHNTM